MDESQEEELWRLRSVEIDLTAAQNRIWQLENQLKLDSAKIARANELEKHNADLEKEAAELHNKWHETVAKLEAAEKEIHALRAEVSRQLQSDYMQETYGFEITERMPRKGWRKAR